MRNGQKIDLGMTGYAELFMTDEERKTQTLPRIVDIPIEMIDDFPDHPFKVRMNVFELLCRIFGQDREGREPVLYPIESCEPGHGRASWLNHVLVSSLLLP